MLLVTPERAAALVRTVCLFQKFFFQLGWGSGESTRLQYGLGSIWRHMWVEFIDGSRPCFESFFSAHSGFTLSSNTNISKFKFDLERLVFICRRNPRRSRISLFPNRPRLSRLIKTGNRGHPRSSGMVAYKSRKMGLSIFTTRPRFLRWSTIIPIFSYDMKT